MDGKKRSKNAPLNAIWIDACSDDVWIRQVNKWKYLGKEKTGLPIDKYEFFNIDHKKDIPMSNIDKITKRK